MINNRRRVRTESAIVALQKQSVVFGKDKMSMDEISAEIKAARAAHPSRLRRAPLSEGRA
jgi:hypothetical protein